MAKRPTKKRPELKGKAGHPALKLPEDQRPRCGAVTNKIGECDKCGFRPKPGPGDKYEPHRGVCPQCGGTMRCRNLFLSPYNGRCQMHGGMTPRGVKASRSLTYKKYLPKGLAKAYEQAASDPDRLSTQAELDLLTSLIIDLVGRLKGGELWDDVSTVVHAIKDAVEMLAKPATVKKAAGQIAHCVEALDKLVKDGRNDVDLRKELREFVEDKSRVAAREAKRLLDLKHHLDVEEGAALLMAVGKVAADAFDTMPGDVSALARKCDVLTANKVEELVAQACGRARREMAIAVAKLMRDPPAPRTGADGEEQKA